MGGGDGRRAGGLEGGLEGGQRTLTPVSQMASKQGVVGGALGDLQEDWERQVMLPSHACSGMSMPFVHVPSK